MLIGASLFLRHTRHVVRSASALTKDLPFYRSDPRTRRVVIHDRAVSRVSQLSEEGPNTEDQADSGRNTPDNLVPERRFL